MVLCKFANDIDTMAQKVISMTSLMRSCLVLAILATTTTLAQSADDKDAQADIMTRWLVLGPIPAAPADKEATSDALRKLGFETDLLAESGGEADLVAKVGTKVAVRGQEYEWKEINSEEDEIDLDKSLGRAENSVAYAYAEIETASDSPELLAIGSDDAVRVWVNGQLAHDHWVMRALRADSDLVPITLQKGKNRLLIKVLNAKAGWGYACRVLTSSSLDELLIDAAATGDLEKLQLLVKNGADVNARGKRGVEALRAARMQGRTPNRSIHQGERGQASRRLLG